MDGKLLVTNGLDQRDGGIVDGINQLGEALGTADCVEGIQGIKEGLAPNMQTLA